MTNEQIKKATIGANKDQAELVRRANLQELIDKEFDEKYEIVECGKYSEQLIPNSCKKEPIKTFIHEKIKEAEDNNLD